VSDVVDTVVERTVELARIPAPTGAEAARAVVVRRWWIADGASDVRVDAVGNVWGKVRGGDGPAVVLCAHLDTVFAADVSHEVQVEPDRLIGPSVGDDSVGVASLSVAAGLLDADSMPVWLLATVGEEGLGNLRGANAALDDPPSPVAAFVAVEGNYLGRVSSIAVGSVRRRVEIRGPGGHAWEAADAPSSVHAAASLVTSIAGIDRPRGTSINVGRIGGGEGINVRARRAWFEVDVRADDPASLASLTSRLDQLVAGVDEPLEVKVTSLGDRSAGRLDGAHALVRAAEDALGSIDVPVTSPATSTDANAAHPRGIPAVALGITRGSGEHTADEWIEIAPIELGVRALATTIERFEELS
jgi:acetylornithine deacetylase/succinyl-diaminopimelate desuccinylase-like protein